MKTRGILQRARRRKKEPEGACTVLLEPGAGFQGSGMVAEDSCSFRPYKHAAKPIFYAFSDAIVQRRFICVEERGERGGSGAFVAPGPRGSATCCWGFLTWLLHAVSSPHSKQYGEVGARITKQKSVKKRMVMGIYVITSLFLSKIFNKEDAQGVPQSCV